MSLNMWIKHIILENFASVKVGMRTERVEIDFTNRKNKICLLVAPNGTGKTSLLSTFTPFATLGNLDVRDSGNLILSGKNGYKEITIIDRGNEYLIKHFYSPNKESHSVKSYIEKNGEELNINGNVRSFQALVESELGIEINFLKLIRLGNNVTNLLQLSATERKKFLSNLLQDLDVYLNYFKKLTDDAKLLKTQISHITDKMKKTGIDDLDTVCDSLKYLKNEIEELEESRSVLLKEKGVIEHSISQYNIDELKETSSDLNNRIKKARKALEKVDASESLSTYQSHSEKISNDIDKKEKELVSLQTKFSSTLDSIDSLLTELKSLKHEIEKEENNENIVSARDIMIRLRNERNELSSQFVDYEVSYTKDELTQLISALMEAQQNLDTAYEFGENVVSRVVSLMREKKNVENYINNGLMEYDSGAGKSDSLLSKLISNVNEIEINCEHEKCDLYHLWVEIKNLMKEEEVIRDSHDTEEFYKYMDVVYQRIKKIFELLKPVKKIIQKLPESQQETFRMDHIFSRIAKLKPIYTKSVYNLLLTEITEYERYLSICDECAKAENHYEALQSTTNIGFLKKKLKTTSASLEEKESDRTYLSEAIHKTSDDIRTLKDAYEQDLDTITALTKMQDMTTQMDEISNKLENYRSLIQRKTENTQSLDLTESTLSKRKTSYSRIEMAINEYRSLNKDLNHYMKLFNENTFIKKSMSSKEGIPLEFINIYMSNIQTTINELLDIVYDGSLIIDDFKINSDEFRIPYIKDGYLIPDISQASQGETAFLSIALSFALISESILHYNIILLDEIDGNLDDTNRKKFISVLERLIDMIDAEQIFLISHNNLFSMYPVDVISLTGETDQNISLANYIPIKIG